MQACRRVDEIASLAARAKGAVAGFTSVMTAIAGHLADGAGPARMVEFAAQESGYLAELEELRTVEAQGRIENIQELSGVAAELIARDEDAGLDQFLEQVSLIGEQDDYDEEESSVTLMTLHIAKGLEFPAVFIVGLEDGDLPALPIDDRFRRARGGAPAALRGYHPGTEAPLPLPRVGQDAVRTDELQPAVAVPERAPGEPARRPRGGWRRSAGPVRVLATPLGEGGPGGPKAGTRSWDCPGRARSRSFDGMEPAAGARNERCPPCRRGTPSCTNGGARASSSP